MADTELVDAINRALEEAPERNFRESVDLAINLRDLDLNDPAQRVDESITLPAGTGRETHIVVFAEGETAAQAESVASEVLDGDELEALGDDADEAKNLANRTDFFIAEQGMMQDIGRYLGRILGPRGKMPTPLAPDDDVIEVVERMKNTVQLRSRDRRTFHAMVGARDMEPEDLATNVDTIIRRLHASLEKGPRNIDTVYIKTTMGPAVEVA